MKSACFFVLSAVLLFIMPIGAHLAYAVEFKSVGAHPAILHDAPSERGRKIFIAPRGMPLEVILTYKEWCKVRDSSGDLSWVESKLLTPKRNVIVTATTAKIRAAAEDNAALVFTADRHVLLELSAPATSGWISVKHRDGLAGFVKAADVWGE
mgnify:FL=1|jgi:SH3-like domain-containing protein